MAPSTALCFLILGGILFVDTFRPWPRKGFPAIYILSVLVSLFGFLELAEQFTGIDLNFENAIVPEAGQLDSVPVARMSPSTGVVFWLAGISVLTFFLGKRDLRGRAWMTQWSAALGGLTTISGLTFLLAYLYGTPLMYGTGVVPMAATTAMAFVLLGGGCVAASGQRSFLMKAVTGPSTRARLLRAFIPLAALAVFFQSMLSRLAKGMIEVNDALLTAVTAMVVTAITVALVSRMAHMVSRDIDLAERKRLRAEAKFRRILESDMIGIIYWDQNGNISEANNTFLKMLGYDREDILLGRVRWKNMLPPEYSSSGDRALKDLLRLSVSVPMEREFIHRDGSRVPILLGSALLEEYEERGVSFVLDITERRKLEGQLRQSQKMEALGTLAGGIAHDFNNVLHAVTGYSEMVLERLPEGSEEHEQLKKVLEAGYRASDLVKQILTFSRQATQNRQPVRCTPILDETLKLLRASIPSTIDIQQNLESEKDTILADSTQIHQVMLNLCTNAAFSLREKGGVLQVSLTDVDINAEAAIRHPELKPGPYLRITVSDTGCGMDETVLKRIFEPFFTTKGPDEGTGMGLAVVHGIVGNCGGAIMVDSEPGKGTTFQVLFPKIDAVAMPEKEEVPSVPSGSARILVVDDEPTLAALNRELLEHLGHEVTATTCSIEALEHFRANPDGFDLVITDLTMPNMTGEILAKELMQVRSDIPVVLCTGFADVISEERIKSLGIRKLVRKPITKSQMENLVGNVLQINPRIEV